MRPLVSAQWRTKKWDFVISTILGAQVCMKNPEIAAFGEWAVVELQRLCPIAHAPSDVGQ
jgi:hypothetical protein